MLANRNGVKLHIYGFLSVSVGNDRTGMVGAADAIGCAGLDGLGIVVGLLGIYTILSTVISISNGAQ